MSDRIEITHPAPDGNGTSFVVNGVEINRDINSFTIEGARGNTPKVTVELHLVEDQRMCMDALLVIGEASAALLEDHGWTRPGVSA